MAATTMDKYCGSEFWNASLTWYTEDPDLTKCFEKTVLIWIPCIFLWIFSYLDIYFILHSKKRNIPWNWLNISKLVGTGILFVLSIADLGTFLKPAITNEKVVYNVGIYTPLIKLLSFALSAILLLYSRKHGLRTSGVQFIFWLLLAVCGAVQLRTELRRTETEIIPEPQYFYISYLIYYSMVIVLLVLNCFADREPRLSKFPKQENPTPEESSSFLSHLLFTWFDTFAWRGFKKPLVESDLWDIKPEDSAEEVVTAFEKNWFKTIQNNERKPVPQTRASYNLETARVHLAEGAAKKEVTILPALIRTFGPEFFFAAFLKLVQDVFVFVNPMIISLLIGFIQRGEEQWKGYLYASLLFVTATFQTIVISQYTKQMHITGMRIRSALIAAIYKKVLRVSNKARQESTVGELMNLMAVDAQSFSELIPYLNIVWSAPLQIVIALFFLWQILGPSVLAGLGVMILLIPINGWITNRSQVLAERQLKHKDTRVKLMNEVLGGIKVLKLYAWEPSFQKEILKIRGKEIKVLKEGAYLNAALSFIFNCAPFLVCLVTYIVYIYSDSKNVLTPEVAIVSLALFNIMRNPMSLLPMLLAFIAQSWVSLKRISNYMNSDELKANNVNHDSFEGAPMVIENGFFNWDEEPILKNINITLEKNSLSAVVGPVGSGKSSLISALLGEMNKISGRVNTLGSIAYVSQQAWIQNATVKDNILSGKPFDKDLYDQVIESCALKQDFSILSAGDQTEIGEKGINLSGGQKQRISLARAVYYNADIYFLDDPLSAVDSHVGKHIFDQVIGPGGILKNKTRILVTHGVGYLPQTDKIIVLKDGEISETGTYQELLDKKGEFSDYLVQHMNEADEDEKELDDVKTQLNGKEEKANCASVVVSETESNMRKKSVGSTEDVKEGGEKLIEDEIVETGGVKWNVYKYYFRAIGWFLTLAAIVFDALFQAFNVASNIWLTEWSNDPTVMVNGTVDGAKRDFYLGIYGTLGLGQALAMLLFALALHIGTLNGARVLHSRLLIKIMRAPCTTFFDVTPIGRILNIFSRDLDTLDHVLPFTLLGFLNAIFTVLSTIFVIGYTTPIFLTITIPIGILYYFVQKIYLTASRQLKRLESVSRSPIYSHFGETISGVQVIRAFQGQERFITEAQNRIDNNQICNYPSIIADQWLSVRLEMTGNVVILFSAVFAVLSKGQNPGLAALSVLYAMQVSQTLNFLVQSSSNVETNTVAVERIKGFSRPPQEAPWEIPKKNPPNSWPETGTLRFNNYSVRYRPGLNLVLKNINVIIRGGEKIGIVGRTGAGKSSLTASLFRIIEASEGEILIDDVNIASLGLHTLRSRLTIIPQDAVLFSGSLRMNLDPSERYSDEEIWQALEHAHLKSYVKSLPAGLHQEVTEGGENFSVGQRQLLCLSRALLRKTKILVLDEATAAVDLDTDDLIQKTIKNEFRDCTILTIAHRLNTIMDSDRVVVLDNGKIVEFDPPPSLLNRHTSIFYGMCKDAGLV